MDEVDQRLISRQKHYDILFRIMKDGNATDNIDSFLRITLEDLIKNFNFDLGCVFLKDDLNASPRIITSINRTFQAIKTDDAFPFRPVDDGSNPVYFENREEQNSDDSIKENGRAGLSIPLNIKGVFAGCINLASNQIKSIKDLDEEIFPLIGDLMGTILERIKAEEAMLSKEEKYRALFFYNPIQTVVVDKNGRITDFNLAKKASGDRLPKTGDQMYVDYASRHKKNMGKELADCIAGGKMKEFDNLEYDEKVLSIHIAPFPEGAIITSEDVTSLRMMQMALKDSESKYRMLVENSLQGVLIIQDGRIVFVNSFLAKKFGYTVDEMVPMELDRLRDLIHPNDLEALREKTQSLTEGKRRLGNYEFRGIHKNGNIIWLEGYFNIIDFAGSPAIITTCIDITARKIAEDNLLREQKFIQAVLNTTPDMIYIYDLEQGRFTFCNNAVAKLTGYDSKFFLDLSREDFLNLIEPEDHIKIDQKLRNFSKTGEDFTGSYLYRLKTKNGEYVWLNDTASVFRRDEDGLVRSIIGSVTDMTARKKAEAEIISLNNELEMRVASRTEELSNALGILNNEIYVRKAAETDLIKAKEEITRNLEREKELGELKSLFINMISHEYRTPLTVILSAAYIIENYAEGNAAESILKYTDKIKLSVQTMISLIEDVMFIGKSKDKLLSYEPHKVNLVKTGAGIIDEVRALDNDSHRFRFTHGVEEMTVLIETSLLRHILFNILLNCIKYSQADTEVSVNIERHGDDACIKIKDQGIGIPEEEIGHIFEPFYRGRQNIGLIKGTGLGLTIVKKCIDIVGGDIQIISNMKKGTEVILKIPCNSI